MRVEYSARARADLEGIGDYIAERNPRAAIRVREAIRRSIDLLRTFPRRGRKQRSKNVRRIGAGRYPYSIYYRVDDAREVITILTIYHAARRPIHENT